MAEDRWWFSFQEYPPLINILLTWYLAEQVFITNNYVWLTGHLESIWVESTRECSLVAKGCLLVPVLSMSSYRDQNQSSGSGNAEEVPLA